MANIYTLHDPKVKADTVVFVSDTKGSAASYFYNYSVVIKRNDLILIQLGAVDHNPDTGFNEFTSIDRIEICRMPEELDENL